MCSDRFIRSLEFVSKLRRSKVKAFGNASLPAPELARNLLSAKFALPSSTFSRRPPGSFNVLVAPPAAPAPASAFGGAAGVGAGAAAGVFGASGAGGAGSGGAFEEKAAARRSSTAGRITHQVV